MQRNSAKIVRVLWDYENVSAPTLCTIQNVKHSIQKAIDARGINSIVDLLAVGNKGIQYSTKNRTQFPLYMQYIPAPIGKQAADFYIRIMMKQWSRENAEEEYLGLIASDKGYARYARIMREQKRQRLLLFGHGDNNTAQELIKNSYIFWTWKELLNGKNVMGTQVRNDEGLLLAPPPCRRRDY